MAVDAPTPVPWRPSERDRELVAGALRDSTVDGRLSPDTFSRRLERAYSARSRPELDELLADLPPSNALQRLVLGALERGSGGLARLRAAWREPTVDRLALPRHGAEVLLGRSPDCHCLLSDPSVSRRHARITHDGERWLVADLGSLNGTRVNGWRIADETEIRPGDRLSLGGARFRLTAPR